MGSLNRHNLQNILNEYRCSYFIETGTHLGGGLRYATQFNFKALYSIEIDKELARQAYEKFLSDSRVCIMTGDSSSSLPVILTHIHNTDPTARILFWLDAHYPSGKYEDDRFQEHEILPLERELEAIRKFSPTMKDVIICDDLRIYLEGDFEHGNLPNGRALGNINFIHSMFDAVHNFVFDYRDEGYLLLFPKLPLDKEEGVR